MKITVFGTGGVGGYFGARLAQGGCDVGFVARGANLAALRSDGLRVRSPLGDADLTGVRAGDEPADLGTPDVVIVSVKLWDLADALRALAPIVGEETCVLSLQNGVQKDELLARAFGEGAVMGGVAYISALLEAPGVVRHNGPIARLVLGEPGGVRSPRLEALHAACVRGGIDATISDDVRRTTWEKFVFLVAMSATTAAMRSNIGPIRTHPRSRAFLLGVLREVVAVGRAHGVPLAPGYADDRLAFIDGLPAGMEASMYADLQRGRRLELPWLSGAVVELGAAHGVEVPLNRAVNDLLAIHELGTSGR